MERVSRRKAIFLKCQDCSGGNKHEARSCQFPECHLYPYRLSVINEGKGKLRLKKVIRSYCLFCMGDHKSSSNYVRKCADKNCPLWIYRMGTEIKERTE